MLRCLPLALLLAAPIVAQGEDCSNPIPLIVPGPMPFDTAAVPTSALASCSGNMITGDTWFAFTAPTSGEYVFTVTSPGFFPPTFAVYSGSDCTATCLAEETGQIGVIPSVGIRLGGFSAGDPVLVRVGALGFSVQGELYVVPVPTSIPNDDCSSPAVISGLGTFPTELMGATRSGFDGGSAACTNRLSGGPGAPDDDAFFQWTATQAGDVRFRVTGAVIARSVSVHAGTGCSAVCLGMNDDDPDLGGWSKTVRDVTVGDSLLVQVGLFREDTTNPRLGTLFVEPALPSVPGDDCSSPIVASGLGSFNFDTTGALVSHFDGGGAPCRPYPSVRVTPSRDLFFVWTALAGGLRRFQVSSGSLADPRIAVHEGSDCSATCFLGDNTNGFDDPPSVVVQDVVVGDTYLVQVSGVGMTSGDAILDVSTIPDSIPNDVCTTPTPIVSSAGEALVPFDTTLATRSWFDGNDSSFCPEYPSDDPISRYSFGDLFYLWTPGVDGAFRMSVSASASDPLPRLSVHLGSDCTATCLAELEDVADTEVVVQAERCTSYLVQVGSWIQTPIASGLVTIESLSATPPDIAFSCAPAAEHAAGARVTLCASTVLASPNGIAHLEPTGGPPGSPGFTIVSAAESAPTPVSNGVLCLALPIGRYAAATAQARNTPELDSLGWFNAAGQFANVAGTAMSTGGSGFDVPASLPFGPPGGTWASGTSLTFQLAYRDGVGSNAAVNFSDAVTIVAP